VLAAFDEIVRRASTLAAFMGYRTLIIKVLFLPDPDVVH